MTSDKITRRDLNKSSFASAVIAGIGLTATHVSAQSNNDDFYALARLVDNLKIPDAVTVVGIGGHGSWPALFSALTGVQSLLITDMGDVEALDIGRTPYRPSDIGKNKTVALSEIIRIFRPNVEIITNTRRLEPGESDIFHGEILFNGVDYKPLEEWLPKAAEEHGMKYVHGFYHGNKVGVTNQQLPNIEYLPGNEVPVWIASAAMSGLLAVFSAFTTPLNFYDDITAMNISEDSMKTLNFGQDTPGA